MDNEKIEEKGEFVELPKFDELPILITVDDDGTETYLVQTHDYRFAQFLAMIQNNANLELIYKVLENALAVKETTEENVNNLIAFNNLLFLWAKKAHDIDDDFMKILKGEKPNESSDDSEKLGEHD